MRSFGDGQGETGEAVWFLSDHLSSTSVTVDENGQALATRQYDPCPPRGCFARVRSGRTTPMTC
jgi:hypothetical protein